MGLVPWLFALMERLLFWGWLALPLVPAVTGWRAWRRVRGVPQPDLLPLALGTASYALLLLGIPFPGILGPSYEWPRYAVIGANLLGTIALTVWAAVRGRALRLHVAFLAALLASLWFVTLLANCAV